MNSYKIVVWSEWKSYKTSQSVCIEKASKWGKDVEVEWRILEIYMNEWIVFTT